MKWLDDIMMNQFEIVVSNPMFDITFSTGEEVIGDNHFMTLKHQSIDQMRTNEARWNSSSFFSSSISSKLTQRHQWPEKEHLMISSGMIHRVTYENSFTILVTQEVHFGVLLLSRKRRWYLRTLASCILPSFYFFHALFEQTNSFVLLPSVSLPEQDKDQQGEQELN